VRQNHRNQNKIIGRPAWYSKEQAVKVAVDESGVATALLDLGRWVGLIINSLTLGELRKPVDITETYDDLKAFIFASAKDVFVVGAISTEIYVMGSTDDGRI